MVTKAIAALTAILSISALQAQRMEHLAVSQVVSAPPELKAYLDVRKTGDAPVDTLSPLAVEGWLDGRSLPVDSLKPFSATKERIAYVFLIDVSGSESRAEFGKVKQALVEFVDRMGTGDKAAVIAFGSEVRTVVPYTGDKNTLQSNIAGLVNDAKKTHLNAALIEGLHLARLSDPNLPSRRSLVVLSDGKDEGSGYTSDDVLEKLKENRIPIYAVGASSLPAQEQALYLEVLHRFAVLSGGAYYDSTPKNFSSAYSQIHDRIAGVWVAELDCSDCSADGRSYPFQIRVTLNGQSQADKLEVALLPASHSQAGETATPPSFLEQYWWAAYAGAGIVLIVLLLLGTQLYRRRKLKRIEEEPYAPADAEASGALALPSNEYFEPRDPVRTSRGDQMGVRVELIRKENRGDAARQYSGKLIDELVIGRSTLAAIRIPDAEISGQHCKLELANGWVLLSDVGSTFGTSVNGIPLKARRRIESGDLIGLGKIEFRISIQT
jgi:hypothetical protein